MVDLEGRTLYEALGVAKDASQAEIRKAYMRLALQLHPDKNPGDEAAAGRFQTLQKVYAILSDDEKRKVYDLTGSVEDSEELAGGAFGELYNYYRSIFKEVTEDDVESFHESFRGSEEERGEVLQYYQRFKGDMGQVFGWVMCSDEGADAHRFMDLLDGAIKAKEVPRFAAYTAWAKKVASKPRPKPGKAAGAKRKGGSKGGGKGGEAAGSESALVAAIRGRQGGALQPFGGVLGALMANMPDEPSEEEFKAAQARLKQRGGGKWAAAGGSGKRAKK